MDKQYLSDNIKQLASGLNIYVYKEKYVDEIIQKFQEKYGKVDIKIRKKEGYFELKAIKKVSDKINY